MPANINNNNNNNNNTRDSVYGAVIKTQSNFESSVLLYSRHWKDRTC